jgi:hypothetical protein
MVFIARERDDGNFELVLDTEGITYLEAGLAELRYMNSGDAAQTPSITEDGVGEFMLRRAREGEH